MQQAQTYQERSREYLVKAFQELEVGDLTQASEKGWGASAQMVKAVAYQRGVEHRSHRSILFAAEAFSRETGAIHTERLFDSARALHGNFYEDTLDRAGVSRRLQDASNFVDRMEHLLHNT